MFRSVREKAHFPLAVLSIFACFGSVPCRVEPAFKDAVCKLAAVTTAARAAPVFWTDRSRVVIPTWVATAGLFAGVGKRAVSPVMAPAASATADLELIHPEVVGRVRVVAVRARIVSRVVAREEFLKKGVVGEHFTGVDGGGSTGEELPWWNVNISEGLLRRKELLRRVKLVMVLLIGTDTHFGVWPQFCCVSYMIVCVWKRKG